MKRPKGVLIDLAGVVYQGGDAIRGSIDAIAKLEKSGIVYRFLTNTTSEPLVQIQEKLKGLGVPSGAELIFTPVAAARRYLSEHGLEPFFLIQETLRDDFAGLPKASRTAVVVGDAGNGFTYAALNQAFRKLQDGADLIALASNRFFKGRDGQLYLDVGAFVSALEYASGKTAVVLGKPAPAFFHMALASIGCAPDEAVMIGDDAEFDASAAIKAGLRGVLVHTGKWRDGAGENIDPRPTAEFENLKSAVEAIVEDED